MRYNKKVIKTESDCDPLVIQWFWDTYKRSFIVINVRNYDPNKIKALKNKILSNQFKDIDDFYDTWAQYITEVIIMDYQMDGIDKIFLTTDEGDQIIMPLDVKGTNGYTDRETGLWVPGYGQLRMEMNHRYIPQDDETVHRPSFPYLRSNVTGWEDDLKQILYISELLAVLIPKVPLNKAINDPKYAYKFDLRNKPWEVNPRDDRDDRLVKNTSFYLDSSNDLELLVDVIETEFSLRNNNGIYVPFTPTIRSAELIKQNYFKMCYNKNK